MCGKVRAKCKCVQPTDALVQFSTLEQEHGESPSGCDERFEQAQDNLKGTLGHGVMNNCMKKTETHKNERDASEQTSLVDNSFDTWCACVHLKNSDDNKCGSVKKNMQSQCALDNDQCPKTLSEVTDVSMDHMWDEAHKAADMKKKEGNDRNNDDNNSSGNKKEEEGTSLAQKADSDGAGKCNGRCQMLLLWTNGALQH